MRYKMQDINNICAPIANRHEQGLTNHLDNVLAVVSDKKETNGNAKLLSASDYYPFGMALIGRTYKPAEYRFGFTGHEKENEITEGVYSTEYRLLDTRLGVWRSTDPLFQKFPSMSSYLYCAGNPITLIDIDGRDWILATGDKVYWYGGNYDDRTTLIATYKATSGAKTAEAIYTMPDGTKIKNLINVQVAKFQFVKDLGPTVEGKYRIDLLPKPNRQPTVLKVGKKFVLGRTSEGGIEKVGKVPYADKTGSYEVDFTELWGNHRARLVPIDVKPPLNPATRDSERDLYSFYFHDSQKGESSGCHEVESAFFTKLLDFRTKNPEIKNIEIKVEYPSPDHSTNGGTEKSH